MEQLLGILFHSIGGFSSASFYVPTYKVKRWAWQTYWITLGFVAWIIMPTIGGLLTTPDLSGILKSASTNSMLLTYLFGVLWGFGGLMAGLGLRYLGLSLGQSICLGVCAIVGTIVPAIMDHKIGMLFNTVPGAIISLGFLICVIGIILCGYAGVLKDRSLNEEEKTAAVKEFSAVKGLTLAVLGGIMSAFMALAINAGKPIAEAALLAGTQKVFVNIPIFVLALAGGFTTNFVYAMILSRRHKSFGDFVTLPKGLLLRNYLLSILSGLMWYGQYFFYGMGATKMGKYDFASWTLHMATIILFSNLWGLGLKEWKLVNRRTQIYLWAGIIMLIISVVFIGIGNHMAGTE
ncbi:L-rhamnose/proton symporter RhaT [Chitinophaga sp. MM2321]|uniref:L-rhamnose/proton symporter RhaT n=1 Tax=Chitinophaga sp. MM2321 TaxID=3137178 RepID=UPI0032D5845F